MQQNYARVSASNIADVEPPSFSARRRHMNWSLNEERQGSLCELASAACADSNFPQVALCLRLKQAPCEQLRSTCRHTSEPAILVLRHHLRMQTGAAKCLL
mmetsp:Transcript_109346/g.273912  ORF Transcript_109346/g.273912 Transcript_109346/m.273912 type:complete len:101 (-) Transcript_109346:1274-1576(-)